MRWLHAVNPPRRAIRLALGLALCALLASPAGGSGLGKPAGKRPPGQFDYYVLALSSVPGFCKSHKDPNECGKGLVFGLHGLWPQFEGGSYPSFCSQEALSAADRKTYQGVYASPTLIDHEWPKHGTCSGLKPADYFALSDADAKHVAIPAAYGPKTVLKSGDAKKVKAAFIAANPGLPAAGVRTVAVKGVLTEVDICLTKAGTKTGDFRPC